MTSTDPCFAIAGLSPPILPPSRYPIPRRCTEPSGASDPASGDDGDDGDGAIGVTSPAAAQAWSAPLPNSAQWAISQANGTPVSLIGVAVVGVSDCDITVADTYGSPTAAIRVLGGMNLQQWNTVDVQGVTSEGAIIPSGVQVYTDPTGEPYTCPMPPRIFGDAASDPWYRVGVPIR